MQQNKWKQKFLTIAIGQAISLIGSSAVQFAMIWWLAEETASPLMMGMAGLLAFLPMTFLSPIAGVAADRYNRKWICITSDLFLGVVALIYAVLLYQLDMPVWSVMVVLFIRGAVGTFQQPAIQSIIPQLVPPEHLVQANGWNQILASGSFILGPVLGAALYAAVPLSSILITDIIGAVIASAALAVVKIPKLVLEKDREEGFISQFKEGVAVYKEDKKLFLLVFAETLCMIFYMPLSSFYPLMTSDYFKLSAFHGSIVETAFALGMLVAAMLFGSVIKVKNKMGVSYLGLLGIGVTCFLCGLLPAAFAGWIIFTVCCGFMGGFGNVHSIPLMAYMQENIPPEKMGRAFSLLGLAGSLTMPVGLLIGSPVAEAVGVHVWFLFSGIGMLFVVCIFFAFHKRLKDRY